LANATLIWDPVGERMILTGGFETGPTFPTAMWTYDGTSWTTIPSNAQPIDSGGPHTVWDEANARLVAYGSAEYLKIDTAWTWEGSSWTPLCTACTGIERIAASLVYDPGMGVLIVGGFIPAVDEIAGTWQLQGSSFVQVETDPPNRDTVGLAYDSRRDVIVMFGGNGSSCGGDCAETWEYVPD
jgi:hypothetical protein